MGAEAVEGRRPIYPNWARRIPHFRIRPSKRIEFQKVPVDSRRAEKALLDIVRPHDVSAARPCCIEIAEASKSLLQLLLQRAVDLRFEIAGLGHHPGGPGLDTIRSKRFVEVADFTNDA